MKTFVLVHGSWHGAWCWKSTAKILRSKGHEVFTPTLSGLGDRKHLLKTDVDMNTHIQDIANLLYYEDLEDVTLVGHSYGGMVITGVAARSPERLAKLVYLDAFIPLPGQNEFDLLPVDQKAGKIGDLYEHGRWFRPPASLSYLGITDASLGEWVSQRLTLQPLAAYDTPIPAVSNSTVYPNIPRAYIHCTSGPSAPGFARFAGKAKAEGWSVHELPTGHDAMLTMPQEVSDLLIEL